MLLALFPYTALALEAVSIESNVSTETPLFSGGIVEYSLIINELQYNEGGVWLRVELTEGVIIKSESIVSGISLETALPALPGEEVDIETEESLLSAITHSITPGNNGFIVLANAIAPGDYINFSAQVGDAGDIKVTVYTNEAEFFLSHARGEIAPSPTPEPPAKADFEPEAQKNNGLSIAALIICALLFTFIVYLLIRKLQVLNRTKTKRLGGKGKAIIPSKEHVGIKSDSNHDDAPPAEQNRCGIDSRIYEDGPADAKDEIDPDDRVGI